MSTILTMNPAALLRTGLSLLTVMATMPASAGLYTFSKIEYPEQFWGASVHSVHRNGQVAVNVAGESFHAYILSAGGKLRELSQAEALQSEVLDVNASGVAVGVSSSIYSPFFSRATVWRGDQASLLPGFGGLYEQASAINDDGLIVGSSYTQVTPISGVTRALWWDADGVHDLGTGGGRSAGAFGLNNSGTIVGSTRFENGVENGTVWTDGAVTHVGTLGGYRSILNDVNDRGWAVGDSLVTGGEEYWHAVLWDGSSLRDLGTLGGGYSFAYGIAEDGTVFGSATTSTEKQHATIWRDGLAVDLHDLTVNIADLGGETLHTAMGVDGRGNIYGYLYDHKTYQSGTFMLTPVGEAEVPEPSTLPLLAAGLLGIAALQRTRRNHG